VGDGNEFGGIAAVVAVTMAIGACGSDSSNPTDSIAFSAPPVTSSPVTPSSPPTPSLTRFVPRDLAVRALSGLDDALRGTAISAVAGGSQGFAMVGKDRPSGALLSWTSPDGHVWTRHWLAGTTFGGGTPGSMIAAPFGYVALGWAPTPGSPARMFWSSADGVTWQPIGAAGLPVGEVTALAAGPWGAAAVVDGGVAKTVVVTTHDGRTWQVADLPGQPISSVVALVRMPDGILVLGWSQPTPPSGDSFPLAWHSRDGHSWEAEPRIAAAIGARENSVDFWQMSPWGAVGIGIGPSDLARVSDGDVAAVPPPPAESGRLVGGPAGLVWLGGVNQTATCASAWQYDGAGWRDLAANRATQPCSADDEATYPVASAASANTILVVGAVVSAPELVGWLVEPAEHEIPQHVLDSGVAPMSSVPDPLAGSFDRPANCPTVPTTLDALQSVDRGVAVACFGQRSIAFRAWIVDPGEGYGGACATFTPVWIHECVLPDYLLASSSSSTANPQAAFHAMRWPSASGATNGVGRWVNVIGHFDDAVSPSCRGSGEPGGVGLESLLPPAVAVMSCRQVFVVTDVRTKT
jgi:hypothetical protein